MLSKLRNNYHRLEHPVQYSHRAHKRYISALQYQNGTLRPHPRDHRIAAQFCKKKKYMTMSQQWSGEILPSLTQNL